MNETKTYETIDDLRAALSDLPEDVVIQDCDGDVVPARDVPFMKGSYAPYTVTYEVPDFPAPLDPSKVKAGDTVTVKAVDPGSPFVMTGLVEKAEDATSSTAVAAHLTIWGRVYTVGRMLTLTAHQPAPEPEPEWKPGTFGWADVPAPHGRAHGFLTDRSFVYLVVEPEQDESTGYNVTSDFSNFNPDVFLAPAKVDVDALTEVLTRAWRTAPWGENAHTRQAQEALAHLGLEAS